MPIALWYRKNRLAYWRKVRRYKQDDIARSLSVTTRTVQNWEADVTLPAPHQVEKLAQILRVTPSQLFPREDFRQRAGR